MPGGGLISPQRANAFPPIITPKSLSANTLARRVPHGPPGLAGRPFRPCSAHHRHRPPRRVPGSVQTRGGGDPALITELVPHTLASCFFRAMRGRLPFPTPFLAEQLQVDAASVTRTTPPAGLCLAFCAARWSTLLSHAAGLFVPSRALSHALLPHPRIGGEYIVHDAIPQHHTTMCAKSHRWS